MRRALVTTVLSVVIASGIPASAHHSNPLYFDMARAITIEGEVLRVEWINPHDHAVAVNRADRQAEGFGDARTGCIAGRQSHPMVGQVDAVEEADDLVRA